MRKYLELFKDGFDATIADKTEVKNWPYVGYSPSEGVVFTVIPEPVVGPADNEIWYTSSDGAIVSPSNVFDVSIVSNEYKNDQGVITFNGPLTSIYGESYIGCSSLKSITIPESVTSIGDAAFYGCSTLGSIPIHNNMTSIGNYAFSGCSSLTSVTIPDSVKNIGSSAFSGCSSITSIEVERSNTTYDSRKKCNAIIATDTNTLIAGCQNTVIPNSVTSIEDEAFYGCSSLTSITIPNSVTSIGSGAFRDCSSLTSITIPNSVTSIETGAFHGTGIYNDNSNWENDVLYIDNCLIDAKEQISGTYTIKENTRLIADSAFSGCSSFTSIVIPESITSIGKWAFGGCKSITSITIPESVTSIEEYTFYDCTSLASITIPNSVTEIGNDAFTGCISLTSVTIPNSVTSIGVWAFSACKSLTSITFEGTIEEWNNITKGSDWNKNVPATYVQCSDGQVAL